jgi:uncharacterized protein YeeX (DUF496 family)
MLRVKRKISDKVRRFDNLKEAKAYLGNDVEFYEIRWVLAEMNKTTE